MPLLKLKSSSLFGNSFFIFLIRFFPSVANLVVLLYYSRFLDKAAYGIYQNFWIQIYFLYPIACFGVHVLITTYAPATVVRLAKSLGVKQYLFYAVWLVLLSVCFAFLQPASLHMGWLIPILFMVLFTISIILESFIIVLKNFKSLLAINLAYALGYLFIHKLVLAHEFSHYHLFLNLLILNGVKVVCSIIVIMLNINKHTEEDDTEYRSLAEIRTLWFHLGFYDILQTLSSWIDKFLVSLLLTAALSAVYFNGTQNIPFLPLILSAAGSSVLIQMTKVKAADEKASLLQLMNQSARYLSNIVFPVMFFLIFFRYEVFQVLLPRYMDAVPVFYVMLFFLPFRTYSFITVFQKLHKGHLSTIGAVGELILACLLMYPLYKWLGLPGLALSFIISSYTQFVFYFYHISRLLNTSVFNLVPVVNWLIKVIIFATLFKMLHYLVTSFFEVRISMLLGIAVMSLTIVVALFIEVRSDKNGN